MASLGPIAGVSLEMYADLVAEMRDVLEDLEACAKIAASHGIERARWDEAVAGWNKRIHDPATCDEMAVFYLPLVQAALQQRGGLPETTFDEFVKMTAWVNRKGGSLERMYQEFQINAAKWSQIAAMYGYRVLREPEFAEELQRRVVEEMERLDGAKPV